MATKANTDAELVSAAVGGSLPAFDTLVRRHTAKMYRVALRIVGDSAEAEDVVQDAWISAWRALPRFRGDSAVSTWLYRVVTNTALAHLRKRKATVPLDTVLDSTPHSTDDPEGSALRGERIDAVLAAIETLDPSQRIPLVLHEIEGMDYEEVAAVLEVSVPALRSRLHRARVALLAKLKELR